MSASQQKISKYTHFEHDQRSGHPIFGFYSERLAVSWCCRWVQLPNDVTQKIDKTLNNTQTHNTTAKQQWFPRHQEKPQKVRNIWVCCHSAAHSKEAWKQLQFAAKWRRTLFRFWLRQCIRSSNKTYVCWTRFHWLIGHTTNNKTNVYRNSTSINNYIIISPANDKETNRGGEERHFWLQEYQQ